MKIKYEMFNPPHPGEVLRKDYVEPLQQTGYAVEKLARDLKIDMKYLSNLLSENSSIDIEVAHRLEVVFENTTSGYWINLQNCYDNFNSKK